MTKAGNKQEFIEHWKKWCESFDDKEPNSIKRQITDMLWDYSIWNLINGSRVYLQKDQNGKIMANATLHDSINRWFFETQTIAIRRLIDEYRLDGPKGVYSIISLLNDIIDNSNFLTRENIFEVRDLPYDDNEGPSRDLHDLIDILSKTDKDKRSKGDMIDKCLFCKIKDIIISQCEKFKIIVNKKIAHAATKESRNSVDYDKNKPILEEMIHAQHIFCKYANFLQNFLTGGVTAYHELNPLPDLFIDWDKPIFQGKNNEILMEIWGEYKKEVEKWVIITDEELKKMVE